MSLNRSEQLLFDYLEKHREERQYWQAKVQKTFAAAADQHEAAGQLATELWRYYEERSAVAAPFREIAQREGLRRISMKSLAELLIRLWTEPKPKKKPAELPPF